MEVPKKVESDNQNGKYFKQMANNIMGKIKAKALIKLDVRFNITEK